MQVMLTVYLCCGIKIYSSGLSIYNMLDEDCFFESNFLIKGEILLTFEGLNLYLLQKSR